jgi:glycerophosphoryl diester phosphodiesterase
MSISSSTSGSGDLSRPLVIAHRGASLSFAENTMPAFEAAIAAGADMIELDVRLTADGVAVVSHDVDVSSTTDGVGLVHEMTLSELKRLDASGGRDHGMDGAGSEPARRAEIPTLREVLELTAGRIGVDVEVKNLPDDPDFDSPAERSALEVVKLLDEFGLADAGSGAGAHVIVSSFNWLSIERVREVAPQLPTGFLTSPAIDPNAALVYARQRGHAYVLPHAYALVDAGEAFVARAHADGVRVGTWTVDAPEDIAQLFAWGVDAVVTNDPATGVSVRDSGR